MARVPAMLNFTAGFQNLRAALASADVKSVVTAHRFIDVGKFEALETELKKHVKLIYLEELVKAFRPWTRPPPHSGPILPRAVASRSRRILRR
jgi:hypothetical protein